MAERQLDAGAARPARAEPRGAHHDEHGRSRLEAELVERRIARITGGDVEAGARHRESHEALPASETARQLVHGQPAEPRIDVQPVAGDDVGVLLLRIEGVVVQRADLVDRRRRPHAEVEDGADTGGPEVLGHVGLADVARRGAEHALLLGQLLRRLERIATPSSPVRVHVENACRPPRRHRDARRERTCRVRAWRWIFPVGVKGNSSKISISSGSL